MTTTPAVLVGQAIGDALGMPFETLKSEVHPDLASWDGSFRPGTWHKLAPGVWTDDTEMAECLARSLIKNHRYDPHDAATRYLKWIRGTPHGAGGTTKKALANFGEGKSWNACGVRIWSPRECGSGTAMRAAPIGARYADVPDLRHACQQDAQITHVSPEAFAASYAVALAVRAALDHVHPVQIMGGVLDQIAVDSVMTLVQQALRLSLIELQLGTVPEEFFGHASFAHDETFIGRRGNACQIVSSALYCALFFDNFKDCVVHAVKLGGDADTRAAITGAIAGARFGLEGIPEEYKRDVQGFNMLATLDQQLTVWKP